MTKVHEIIFSQCFGKFSGAEFDIFHWSLALGRFKLDHCSSFKDCNLVIVQPVIGIETDLNIGFKVLESKLHCTLCTNLTEEQCLNSVRNRDHRVIEVSLDDLLKLSSVSSEMWKRTGEA